MSKSASIAVFAAGDSYYCSSLIFTLVPIACLGYLLYSTAPNLESAVTATQITYIGGESLSCPNSCAGM
ncbi:MAG: hypothetical protein IJ106_00945 [Parasporobacterium sp.]|nr:hypothetical protein [Parasporobacterium sp.]